MRIGPRYNMSCCDIVSSNGCALQWMESVRYLGVYFVKARQFKCRYDQRHFIVHLMQFLVKKVDPLLKRWFSS